MEPDEIPLLVYIAGRYRGKSPENVALNIAAARHVGLLAAQAGFMPVIPHANTEGFEHLDPTIHDEFWLKGTLQLMRKCDAVVLVPGWEQSSGTRGEVLEAQRLGIPVYLSVANLVEGDRFL
jgi:nucleoside 2-deoxyribosyltransferase